MRWTHGRETKLRADIEIPILDQRVDDGCWVPRLFLLDDIEHF
jgi:hypothetical protein